MKLSKLISRVLYNSTYKYLISHFFKEVIDDIKVLEEYNLYSKSPNPIVNYIYENEDYELIPEIKEIIKKRYKEKYCPTSLFEYFTQSEKMNYLMLRVEINKLLNIKDTCYRI